MAQRVVEGVFFTTPRALPRGRHDLSRDEVRTTQRERAMIAATELLAHDGCRGVGVREVCARAGLSRETFYECFADKDECVYAAYDRFIGVLVDRLAAVSIGDDALVQYVRDFVAMYFTVLQDDLVVARAFQVEMDALGPAARKLRREALVGVASFLRERYAAWSPELAARLPLSAFVGAVYGVRQIACDALDEQDDPDLQAQVPEIAVWVNRLLQA